MSMLYEFEAKELYRKFRIPTPKTKLYTDAQSIKDFVAEIGKDEFMAKGQALAGGRGKAGLIKKVTSADAEPFIKSIIGRDHKGKPVKFVMLEEPVTIEKEYYLTLMVNNAKGTYHVLASSMGGVDIEAVAEEHPDEIHRQDFPFDIEPLPFHFVELGKNLGFTKKTLSQFTVILSRMFTMAKKSDLTLVEINPLILTKENKLIAADAKIVIDGNAYFRQPEIASLTSQRDQHTDLEFEATEAGISYVELEGDIGIITGGAGLSMATCDLIEHYGVQPANFLDVGGGADETKVEKALDIIIRNNVKGIFVNIFAGITRCDDVAQGIVNASKTLNLQVPMVIRLVGTNDAEGIKILEAHGYNAYGEMRPAAKKIVELVTGGN